MAVSRQGEFKNTMQMLLQKVHASNFPLKNRQKFRRQFFLDFFGFITFSGVSQRREFKKYYKKRFTKASSRKVFTKKPKTLFLDFF
jgi:hypothetical protein